jgi:hypothetical protein
VNLRQKKVGVREGGGRTEGTVLLERELKGVGD